MNPIPSKCPVCGGELVVTQLHCPSCETTIKGSFAALSSPLQEAFTPEQLRSLLPFARLNKEQLYFMLTFMRCEGRLNRMEDELSLSYPTLRIRLDEIIRALGFEPGRDEGRGEEVRGEVKRGDAARLPGPAERQAILDMLNRGEISVEDARRKLRGEPAGTASRPSTPLDAGGTASRPLAPLDVGGTASRPLAPLDAGGTASRPSTPLDLGVDLPVETEPPKHPAESPQVDLQPPLNMAGSQSEEDLPPQVGTDETKPGN